MENLMFNTKHLLATSLLSLGMIVSGCANANSNTTNTKPMPVHPVKMDKTDHHKGKMDKMPHHHFDKLNLTDDQKAQLETIHKQNHEKMEQLHAKLKTQADNIKKQKEANANTATLLALYEEKQTTVEELADLHKNAQKQFMSILTPEQKLSMYEGHQHKHHHMKKPEKKAESK